MQKEQVNSCTHMWLIETPKGPMSKGKCKFCGETNEFINSAPRTSWTRVTKPNSSKANKNN